MNVVADSLLVEQALCQLETGNPASGIFYNIGAGVIERIFTENEKPQDALNGLADFLWENLKTK